MYKNMEIPSNIDAVKIHAHVCIKYQSDVPHS